STLTNQGSPTMRILRGIRPIFALLLCTCAPGIAAAEVLISPPVFVQGGPAGGTVTCRIFQFSALTGEPIATPQVFSNVSASPIPLSFNSCRPLGRNENCSFGVPITGNLSYTCTFGSGGLNGSHYTGTIEIQDSGGNVLAREAMRPL